MTGVRGAALEVVDPGPLCLVQDLGRPGLGRVAVGRSGAFDRAALRLANRLVGNDEGAAGLEALVRGPTLRARRPALVAVTGAAGPVTIDGRPADRGSPLWLSAGATLAVGPATHGLRAYVAVRGGLDVPRALGSAARDTLSGLGPDPLRAGDRLALGAAGPGAALVDHVPPVARADEVTVLRVVIGPDDDVVGAVGIAALLATTFTVAPASDRVGLRLTGPPVPRPDRREVPSAPLVRGAIQVPPDGRPVVMGPDHPVTGGYPVAAVVVDSDTDRCGQVRPGDRVSFRDG